MDVASAKEATIAQEAGACAVMALERVPAHIQLRGDDLVRVLTTRQEPYIVGQRFHEVVPVKPSQNN